MKAPSSISLNEYIKQSPIQITGCIYVMQKWKKVNLEAFSRTLFPLYFLMAQCQTFKSHRENIQLHKSSPHNFSSLFFPSSLSN